jgi:hypothetical protein
MRKVLLIAFLLIVSGPSEAQTSSADADAMERAIYDAIADVVRAEFEQQMAMLARTAPPRSPEGDAKAQDIIKFIAYNKAAIYVHCVVESQRDRDPGNYRVGQRLQRLADLCLGERITELQRFTQLIEFVGLFGADRIPDCERKARLPDREQVLPPYEFLVLSDPRLYNFAVFNRCLMPGNAEK